MKITLKPCFFVQDIAGEKILMGGETEVDFSKMMVLNHTSAWIIELLQEEPMLEDDIAQDLTERFDVDYEQAFADVQEFCRQLQELNVVTAE